MVRVSVPIGAWGEVGCPYEERDLEGVVGEPAASQWSMKHPCSHLWFLLGHHGIYLSRDTWGAEPGLSDCVSWDPLPAPPNREKRCFFAIEDANHHFWSVQGNTVQAHGSEFPLMASESLSLLRPPGMKRFCRDIHMMLGFKPGPYFRACWMVLSPATMMVTAQLEVLESCSAAGILA